LKKKPTEESKGTKKKSGPPSDQRVKKNRRRNEVKKDKEMQTGCKIKTLGVGHTSGSSPTNGRREGEESEPKHNNRKEKLRPPGKAEARARLSKPDDDQKILQKSSGSNTIQGSCKAGKEKEKNVRSTLPNRLLKGRVDQSN